LAWRENNSISLITGMLLTLAKTTIASFWAIPDHLDRYPSFEHYVKSKLSLYQYCQHPVINADEPLTPTLDNATRQL
jgi:UDP-N-acetylmuramoylalanine-D-glutamate ligase